MIEEKEKGFEHIIRRKKVRENATVVGLRESEMLIGQLYPVLTDEEGNVLDGQHRLKANPNWRREVVKGVDSERKRTMIRLHANWHRRRKQPDKVLEELAKITEWKGAAPYAAFLGCSVRTVQRHLPQKYKMRQRTPKRQLSLSREKNVTPYEANLRRKLIEEEDASLPPAEGVVKWTKERLLSFLGNRLYNHFSMHTEPPEVLLQSPNVKEECEFYLTELAHQNVPRREILDYLEAEHKNQLATIEELKIREERKKVFKDKLEEMFSKYSQITIEFTDGTKIPLNVWRLRCFLIISKEEVKAFIKEMVSGVVRELLKFDEMGCPLEEVG